METSESRLKDGLRHDPQAARRSVRQGKERGVRVYISAAELRAAGIDTDGPPPTFRVWASKRGRGSVQLRFYSA